MRDITSQVKVNGFLTDEILITRGVRQGDPLSSLLYIIVAEALSNLIRTNKDINPISTGLFCLVVALGGGGGVFSTPFHNSFVFKVRLLKFCTEILSDTMNNLR